MIAASPEAGPGRPCSLPPPALKTLPPWQRDCPSALGRGGVAAAGGPAAWNGQSPGGSGSSAELHRTRGGAAGGDAASLGSGRTSGGKRRGGGVRLPPVSRLLPGCHHGGLRSSAGRPRPPRPAQALPSSVPAASPRPVSAKRRQPPRGAAGGGAGFMFRVAEATPTRAQAARKSW